MSTRRSENGEVAGCMIDENRGFSIHMWSGIRFFPGDPRVEDIDIRDVFQSLANQCRYNGLCNRFYTVAEHSVHCWSLAPDEFKREALLHDAAEVFTGGDMPRPIKQIIPGYIEFEKKIEGVVNTALGIPVDMSPEVKHIDDLMLSTERRILCPNSEVWPGLPEPLDWTSLPCWSPEEARAKFIEAYNSLY